MSEIIKVENLSFSYPNSSKVLDKIDLKIKKGEMITIFGPSGSGKTTLIYCLSGIIPHLIEGKLTGNVFIKGKNTKKMKMKEITKYVGVVLQDPESQIFGLTVEEDISFGLENLGLNDKEIEERVNKILDFMGLKKYRDFNPRLLSGGQKQKLVIGSVLAMDPEIIFLDEPFSNIEPKFKLEIFQILHSLKREGKTIILVERKIPEFLSPIDRFVLIDSGKILVEGEPEKFFTELEKMKYSKIHIPQIVSIYSQLRKLGFLTNMPLSVEELEREVLSCL